MKPKTTLRMRAVLAVAVVLSLGACSGSYDGGSAPGNSGGGGAQARNVDELFGRKVQPRLDFCRTCHVPGAAGDVDNGRDFQLSANRSEDFANLKASWTRLGGNNPTSRILLMASGLESHTGGAPWPQGSDSYKAMDVLLKCFGDPSGCAALLDGVGGGVVDDFPLLGSARGSDAFTPFCAGKPDDAVLPVDPRTLVQPGVNEGKAVAFNAYWRDCPNKVPPPKTCGEYRGHVTRGERVMQGHGQPGSAHLFGAAELDGLFVLSSESYRGMWRAWGLDQRPEQFDLLVAERYGSPQATVRNPYPLEGEDPKKTNGGSGQLPALFTQLRQPDGTWTGKIGVKSCNFCHAGQLGTPQDGEGLGPQFGGVGTQGEISVYLRDLGRGAGALLPILITKSRGTGAIDQFQLGYLLFSKGRLDQLLNPEIVFSGAIGTIKSPNFWNMGHRPQKFHGAVLPMDASRIDLAEYYRLQDLFVGKDPIHWVDDTVRDAQVWAESLSSPKYPMPIDTALAEQGAVLFHSKNLWAESLDNPVPKPSAGNGSCAGCHGAYSPRYVNDPAYLETPLLEGIAAYVAPMAVIDTDPIYIDSINSLKDARGGYNQASAKNDFLYCGLGAVADSRDPGMLTPPLYGVWAAAPYLHNGSVPNLWTLLKPSERPKIWRRVSTPAPKGLEGKVVMGYDTHLQRAYDAEKLGWRYDVVGCGDAGTNVYITCNPADENQPVAVQQWLGALYRQIGLAWLLPLPSEMMWNNARIENRKVYSTYLYSQSNQGHEFTAVLTDQERRALIEYLKTL